MEKLKILKFDLLRPFLADMNKKGDRKHHRKSKNKKVHGVFETYYLITLTCTREFESQPYFVFLRIKKCSNQKNREN